MSGILPTLPLAQAQPAEEPAISSSANPPPPLPDADVLSEGTLKSKARLWLYDIKSAPILVPEETAAEYFLSRDRSLVSALGQPALERVEVEAEVVEDFAQVTGRFSVVFAQDVVSTVNLGFGQVQISQQSFTGDQSRNRLQTVRDDPGWRWVVQGEPNTTQTATLTGVTRIEDDQERRSLHFSLPTAPCTLRLKLPPHADDLRVRREDVLQRKESTGGKVEVEVNCRGGEFTLSWRERANVPQIAAILATSETRFEVIDPTQPWLAHTTLKVRWHGSDAASQIRIQLPPGGQWRPLPKYDHERYLILPVDEALPETDADLPQTDPATGPATDLQPAKDNQVELSKTAQAAVPVILENIDVTRYDSLEILLEWEWSPTLHPAESAATEVKIQTPILHGVDQHTGTIDCEVTSAYSIVFKEGSGSQFILQTPLMDTIGQHLLRFKFDRQPFDLSVVFRREQSLPTIRPTYLVNVDRHKLTLTMWFDCSFDTNQPQMELGLMLDEWVIQENTARVVSNVSDSFSSAGEVLQVLQQVDRDYVIRSTNGPPINYGGVRHIDQTWRVVAERAWSAEDHELFFQVPQIIRGRANGEPVIDHGSGALLITSDTNVLLSWQETAGTGLQRDSFSSEYERFAPQAGLRKPMVYRFQSSETTPRWAGRAELLPQQVTAGQQVELEAGVSQVTIRQKFDLHVAYEALNNLQFAVRQDAAESQPPQVLINGQIVSARPLSLLAPSDLQLMLAPDTGLQSAQPAQDGTDNSTTAPTLHSWQSYQVDGPEIVGETRIEIRSNVNWKSTKIARPSDEVSLDEAPPSEASTSTMPPGSTEDEYTRVEVPLAQLLLPSGVRRTRQTWTLTADARVDVIEEGNDLAPQSLAAGWKQGVQRSGTFDGTQSAIQLSMRPRQQLGIAPVRIEMSWLQSFVSDQKRRERFVARVTSSSNELQLKLPPAVNIREKWLNISVNGFNKSEDSNYDKDTDIVTIPLGGTPGTSQIVEVSYFLPDALSWLSVLSISPPEILGAEPAERFYWQLLTPSVQHLGWSPPALTAEWTWKWSGLCWHRASQLNQQQLEEIIGAKPQEPAPASANSYVMSGRGAIGTTDAWVLSRFILWFPVGLLAIAISFTALNYAIARKPVVVVALAVAVAALATIWPDLAVLAGQTALLSVGLVALVWVSQAAVDSRVRRRSVFTARPSTYIDRSDHHSLARSGRPMATLPPAPAAHGSSTGTSGG